MAITESILPYPIFVTMRLFDLSGAASNFRFMGNLEE